jgi:hypothetical protein
VGADVWKKAGDVEGKYFGFSQGVLISDLGCLGPGPGLLRLAASGYHKPPPGVPQPRGRWRGWAMALGESVAAS